MTEPNDMCTNIVHRIDIDGSGKTALGWMPVTAAAITYDHPTHANVDHAINIDFVNPSEGLAARVPVELSLSAARQLALTLLAAVEEAEAFEAAAQPAAVTP